MFNPDFHILTVREGAKYHTSYKAERREGLGVGGGSAENNKIEEILKNKKA